MANEDRRDDWRQGIDEKLVNLTSAQRSTDDELDDLDLKYASLDRIIRGDPENDISGFQERLHNVENGLHELLAEKVKLNVADSSVQGIKWQSVTSIACAIIAALSFILPNIDKIWYVLHNNDAVYEPDEQLKKAIAADKRRHAKKTLVVHVVKSLQPPTTSQ